MKQNSKNQMGNGLNVEKTIKEITVKLFDDKRDVITRDCIYWVDKNTLFPFDHSAQKFTEEDYKAVSEIGTILSFSNSSRKCEILARMLHRQLEQDLNDAGDVD